MSLKGFSSSLNEDSGKGSSGSSRPWRGPRQVAQSRGKVMFAAHFRFGSQPCSPATLLAGERASRWVRDVAGESGHRSQFCVDDHGRPPAGVRVCPISTPGGSSLQRYNRKSPSLRQGRGAVLLRMPGHTPYRSRSLQLHTPPFGRWNGTGSRDRAGRPRRPGRGRCDPPRFGHWQRFRTSPGLIRPWASRYCTASAALSKRSVYVSLFVSDSTVMQRLRRNSMPFSRRCWLCRHGGSGALLHLLPVLHSPPLGCTRATRR